MGLFSSAPTAVLSPIPSPGLNLFDSYTPSKATTLITKDNTGTWSRRAELAVSYMFADGTPAAPLFNVKEEAKHEYVFRDAAGDETMRVVRKVHKWSQNHEYTGLRANGTPAWRMEIQRSWKGTEYAVAIFPTPEKAQELLVQDARNSDGAKGKAVLFEGQPVASIVRSNVWSWRRREDIIEVAPGMDILLTLGVWLMKLHKDKDDANTAAAAAASAA